MIKYEIKIELTLVRICFSNHFVSVLIFKNSWVEVDLLYT